MFRIGIDVGSTYTKYCVMDDFEIISLFSEKTPIRQKEYFDNKIRELRKRFPDASFYSCGYGRRNVELINSLNELTALARGSFFITRSNAQILDIGGQDTKLIQQSQGKLTSFFTNDKCAAGSGMFLSSVLDHMNSSFHKINLVGAREPSIHLSSVCAVFAQSEIVELIAENRTDEEIIRAVIWQILIKSRLLLDKLEKQPLLLSGGLTQIPGIADFASSALDRECYIIPNGQYMSAIGSAVELEGA